MYYNTVYLETFETSSSVTVVKKMETKLFRTMIKLFFKKWTAAQIKIELHIVHVHLLQRPFKRDRTSTEDEALRERPVELEII